MDNPSTQDVTLGRTGLQLAPMGLGTMTWGRKVFMTPYGGTRSPQDEKEAYQDSIEEGVNLFDTAELYGSGNSELRLGELLKEEDVFIATKYAPTVLFIPFLPRRATRLRTSLDASLERLGRARVDLYQIHYPAPFVRNSKLMEQLAKAVEEGKTRAVGVSNYSEQQMRKAHETLKSHGIPLASNQVQYSLLYRKPEMDGVFQACEELGVTLIAYMPLAMGALSGKYRPGEAPSDWMRRMGQTFRDRQLASLTEVVHTLSEIGNRYKKSPAQVSLRWVIEKGALPIPGAKNGAQARENAGALSFSLSTGEMEQLESVTGGWVQKGRWKRTPVYRERYPV